MLGLSIFAAAIWFAAAATDNTLLVTVNQFGERNIELVMWALVVPIISVGLYRWTGRGNYENS
jgi:hypothetical protein